MTRALHTVLLLACALPQPAAAHMIWLEREGATVQLYYGEPAENLRERTGAELDRLASPRLVGASAPASRQPDHVAFGPLPPGEPDLVFAAGPGIRRVIAGELTPAEAIDQDVLAVASGEAPLLERFAETFHIDTAVAQPAVAA